MKILKVGKVPEEPKPIPLRSYTATCNKCSTVVEYTENEMQGLPDGWVLCCPICKKLFYV